MEDTPYYIIAFDTTEKVLKTTDTWLRDITLIQTHSRHMIWGWWRLVNVRHTEGCTWISAGLLGLPCITAITVRAEGYRFQPAPCSGLKKYHRELLPSVFMMFVLYWSWQQMVSAPFLQNNRKLSHLEKLMSTEAVCVEASVESIIEFKSEL